MWTIIAAIAIIGVAIGATYVRYETYQQEKTAETIGANTSPNNSLFSLEGLASEGLPDVLTEPQTEANNQAHNEQEGARDAANLTTYAILATLFILIQIMGIGIGYKTGFAGKESSTARRIIRNFPSRTSYEAWYERKRDAIARVAQKHLSNLQARLTENATSNGVDKTHREVIQHSADRTFIEHYEQTEIKAEQSRQNSEARKLSRTVESKLQPSESIKTTSAPDPVNQGKTAAESPEEMEARIRRELLAEKEAKEKHVETEDEMRERMRKELGLGS
jgi:multidrug efflux pump subunit AcrB